MEEFAKQFEFTLATFLVGKLVLNEKNLSEIEFNPVLIKLKKIRVEKNRVAKRQYFTQIKSFKLNFTPRKAR